ncbi:response regulator [Chryseobacterium arachidis]
MKELDVLLVDDNPVNMILNNRMMKSLVPDANLTEAVNGLEALEACKNKNFSIILMDVQMPVMNGIEATRQIRLLPGYKDVPIIGVTAGNVLGEKEKCIDSGMNDFLPKPLRQSDLSEMLKKYIAVEEDKDIIEESGGVKEKYIDMDMLNDQTGGDEDFKEIFLNLVINELIQTKDNIGNVVAEKNTADAKMILHKLKGTAGTAGLFRLSECALKWEKKADENIDFSAMEKEIKEEITIGLDIIKSLIQ